MDGRHNSHSDRVRSSNPVTLEAVELHRYENELQPSKKVKSAKRKYIDSTQPRVSRDTSVFRFNIIGIQERHGPGLRKFLLDSDEGAPVERLDISSTGIPALLENRNDIVDVVIDGQSLVRTNRI